MTASVNHLRNATHIKTEVDVHKLGRSGAEVCFLGRSNVGKSSLINALCSKRNMARASQVPGKTRTVNVYEAAPGRWLIDLPGYGYAVGGSNAKEELGAIIEGYLKGRETLQMVYVIIDAVAGFTKLDTMMSDWLRHFGVPFSFVVNKIDKIPAPKLDTRKTEILRVLSANGGAVFWVSTTKDRGIGELRRNVSEHLRLGVSYPAAQ